MKRAFACMLVVSISGTAFAQSAETPSTTQAPADAAVVQKAERLLGESAKAYATAAALTDVITFDVKTPTGNQTETIKVAIQGADSARVSMTGMTVTALGTSLFVERDSVAEVFAELPKGNDLVEAMQQQVGFVPPQIIARTSQDIRSIIEAFLFRMLPEPKVTGVTERDENGLAVYEIAVAGATGEGALLIDAKTKLVRGARVRMVPQGAPAGFEVVAKQTYEPVVSETLAQPIAFDPGSRRKVTSLGDLKVDLVGKPAPDFTLPGLDGKDVTLSDLKGSMVVLDFWATWCGPCKRGLPKLQEFATWAKDNDKPVKVFAVNVWERTSGDETVAAVKKFWSEQGYTIPTLLDAASKSAEAYGFDSIPTTIIIDPQGKVFRIHTGFNPEMLQELQKDLEDIQAKSGS